MSSLSFRFLPSLFYHTVVIDEEREKGMMDKESLLRTGRYEEP